MSKYFPAVLVMILIIAGQSCHSPKKAQQIILQKTQPQFIQAIINNKEKNFRYQVHGTYNQKTHRISLRAADTTFSPSSLLAIEIELGKDTTLDMLQFPRTFSAHTDTFPRRQITYAGLHWDNNIDDVLYENYTYRSYSDLEITLTSFSADSLIQGNFSGSIWQKRKRARIRNGSFSVYLHSK